MYQSIQHPLADDTTHNLCHTTNTRYLASQRRSYGMWLWLSLSWRDIFRLTIILILFSKALDHNKLHTFAICFLIPHFICFFAYIFAKMYERHQVWMHEANRPKYYAYEWFLCIIGYSVTAFLAFSIFPSSTFYSIHWGHEYGNVCRLFTDCKDIKLITTYLLKYILNNNNIKEIKRRIVVVNYYTTLLFIDQINDNCLKQINYFSNMHNTQSDGLFKVTWTDLQKAGGYNINTMTARWFRFTLATLIVIYDIVLLIFLVNILTISLGLYIICLIHIISDIIWLLFDLKYVQLYWYCHHILPFVGDSFAIDSFLWKTINNIDDMMENIEILYHIMFDFAEKNILIQNNWTHIHPDIANIIGEYLWCALPVYHNKNGTEFKMEFDKMIKSFKDCTDEIDGDETNVYINTH